MSHSQNMFLQFIIAVIFPVYLAWQVSAAFSGNLEVPLTRDPPHGLSAEITVGSSADGTGQKLKVQFDTGSTHLWLAAKENTIKSRNFKPYDGSKSEFYKTSKSPFSVNLHHDDDITGYLAEDKLQIGSGENAIVLDKQEFGEATRLSNFMNGKIFENQDGLFGINLQEESAGQPKSPLLKMAEKYGKAPVIGYFIDTKNPSGSKILFDGDDKGLYKGDINAHNVVKKNGKYDGWNVKITKFVVGKSGETGKEVSVPEGSYANIVSRMPPHIIGPKAVMDKVFEKLFTSSSLKADERGYSGSCKDEAEWQNLIKDLPLVTIYIDEKPYPLEPESYIHRLPDGKCIASVHSTDKEQFVFGKGFLERYYAKFDFNQKKVHLASVK